MSDCFSARKIDDNWPGKSFIPEDLIPVVDELAAVGYRFKEFEFLDYGDLMRLYLYNEKGSIAMLPLRWKACGIVFDILDTPWWASVQKRKEQEFQAAVNERVMSEWKDGVAATESAPDELMQIAKEQNAIARDKALNEIALRLQMWLDWYAYDKTLDDAAFLIPPVPICPTRWQLNAWIEVLKTPERKS